MAGSLPPSSVARSLREIVLFMQRRGIGGGRFRSGERDMVFDRLMVHDRFAVDGFLGRRTFFLDVDGQAAHETPKRRQRDIETDGKRGDQALRFAVFGDERQSTRSRDAVS